MRHSRNQLWLSQHQGLLRRSCHKGAPAFPAVKAPLKHTLAQQQKCDISVHLDRVQIRDFIFLRAVFQSTLFKQGFKNTVMETTKAALA